MRKITIWFHCKLLVHGNDIISSSGLTERSITETLERDGQTDPYFHAVSRPKIAEDEASVRDIHRILVTGHIKRADTL